MPDAPPIRTRSSLLRRLQSQRDQVTNDEHQAAEGSLISSRPRLSRDKSQAGVSHISTSKGSAKYRKPIVKESATSRLLTGLRESCTCDRFLFLYLDVVTCVCVASSLLTIVQTYYVEHDTFNLKVEYFEIMLLLLLLLNAVIRVTIGESLFKFFSQRRRYVELLGVLATVMCIRPKHPSLIQIPNEPKWASLNWAHLVFHVARGLRIVRLWLADDLISNLSNGVQRKISSIALFILTIILCTAAILRTLERAACTDGELEDEICPTDRPFHEWMYFLVVTYSTVGFGDVSCATWQGRLVTIALICSVTFAIVPYSINEVVFLMTCTTPWSRAVYSTNSNPESQRWHVLVVGHLASTSLTDFLRELLHQDHMGKFNNAYLEVVVMQPEPPGTEVKELLRQPIYRGTLRYLQGSPFKSEDLKRACAEKASGIFMFCNKFSRSAESNDAQDILLQYAIKRYVLCHTVPSDPMPVFCCQLMESSSRRHLLHSPESCHSMMFLNEVRNGIIAMSCYVPGVVSLVFNLFQTYSTEDFKQVQGSAFSMLNDKCSKDEMWLEEYRTGLNWEVYSTELKQAHRGRPFNLVCRELYKHHGLLLIGIGISRKTKTRKGSNSSYKSYRVVLNPGTQKIPKHSQIVVEGFVVARNATVVQNFHQNEVLAERDIIAGKSKSHQVPSKSPSSDQVRNVRRQYWSHVKPRYSMMFDSFTGSDRPDAGGIRESAQAVQNKQEGEEKQHPKSALWAKLSKGAIPRRAHKKQQEQQEMLLVRRTALLEGQDIYDETALRLKPNWQDLSIEELWDQVFVETSLLEEHPAVRDHLIVTVGAESLHSLPNLVQQLRYRSLPTAMPIAILYSPVRQLIPLKIVKDFAKYEDVYLVEGSHIVEQDLVRVGIFFASHVVMLANDCSGGEPEDDAVIAEDTQQFESAKQVGMHSLVDSGNIFSFRQILYLNPRARVLVEVIHRNNMAYLGQNSSGQLAGNGPQDYHFSLQFASGCMFTPSMLDSLVAQQYYNPVLLELLGELVLGQGKHEEIRFRRRLLNKQDDLIDEILGSSLAQVPIPDEFKGSECVDAQLKQAASVGGRVVGWAAQLRWFAEGGGRRAGVHMPVCAWTCGVISAAWSFFPHRSYSELVDFFLDRGIVPLGLYRGVEPPRFESEEDMQRGFETEGFNPPYVVANPPPETKLYSQTDMVFVLQISKPHFSVERLCDTVTAIIEQKKDAMGKDKFMSKKKQHDKHPVASHRNHHAAHHRNHADKSPSGIRGKFKSGNHHRGQAEPGHRHHHHHHHHHHEPPSLEQSLPSSAQSGSVQSPPPGESSERDQGPVAPPTSKDRKPPNKSVPTCFQQSSLNAPTKLKPLSYTPPLPEDRRGRSLAPEAADEKSPAAAAQGQRLQQEPT